MEKKTLVRAGGVAVIGWVAAKALWALPVLDRRTELVMTGAQIPPSPVHDVYVVCELIELVILLAMGFATLYAHARAMKTPRAEVRHL